MDENEKKSSWDDLIQDLGAQPDESAFERKQPPPQEIPPSVDWEEAANLEEPAAQSSDWNALADSLGLEVEPEPEEVADSEPSAASSTDAASDASSAASVASGQPTDQVEPSEQPPKEVASSSANDDGVFGGFLAPEDAPIEESTSELPPATTEQASEEADEGTIADEAAEEVVDEDLPPLPSQMDQAMNDTAWEDDQQAAADEDGDDLDGRGISGEAARSAFDALFADGASSWGSAFLDKPKRDFLSPVTDDAEAGQSEVGQAEAGQSDASEADGEEQPRPKRKRSRRRRRGGRGRKPAEEKSEATTESDLAAATDADDSIANESGDNGDELADGVAADEEPKKPRRRRSRRRSRSRDNGEKVAATNTDADELDGDDLEDGDDEDGTEARSRTAGNRRQRHRNIPTWSEAIGMIVDANLEERAKNPSKPQSSRGGRGRGGRRRGGRSRSEGKQ